MRTKNPMQLKALIKNRAAKLHISAQLVMQNYVMERLLMRISLSPYKRNFIIKDKRGDKINPFCPLLSVFLELG